MKRILILGGTSFVSRAVSQNLIKFGYQVDILTRGIIPLDYFGVHEHIICNRTDSKQLNSILLGKNMILLLM